MDEFDKFFQDNDLKAAKRCVEVCEEILADSSGKVTRQILCPSSRIRPHHMRQLSANLQRHHLLSLLSRAFLTLSRHHGGSQDLTTAVRYGAEAVVACVHRNVVCPMSLVAYGCALSQEAVLDDKSESWAIAERMYTEALAVCGTGHPLRVSALSSLAWSYLQRMRLSGNPSYIDLALGFQHMAITHATLVGRQLLPRHLAHVNSYYLDLALLGVYLQYRNNLFKDVDGLEEGIRLCTKAVTTCPPTYLDRALVMLHLAGGLRFRFERNGAHEDVEEAIELGNQALKIVDPGTPTHGKWLMIQSTMLRYRFEAISASDHDLDTIVELKREALRLHPAGHMYHWNCLSDLANALRSNFLWRGNINDLNEAMLLYRQAVEEKAGGDLTRWVPVRELMACLETRFEVLGHSEDVDEAVCLGQEAVQILSPSIYPYGYTGFVLTLCSVLNRRFEITGDIKGPIESIQILEKRLPVLTADSPLHPERLSVLCRALLLRGTYTRNLADLEKAIHAFSETKIDVSKSGQGPDYLCILSDLYLSKFRLTGDAEDAESAKHIMVNALDLVPAGRRLRFRCMLNIAELYLERGSSFCDISTALRYAVDAVNDNHGDVRSRIQSTVQLLGSVAKEYPDISKTGSYDVLVQLLSIYASIVALLPRIAYFDIDHSSRLRSLFIGHNIATAGALHALGLSKPEQAVEMLEQGRGIFWTHSLRLRSGFDKVPTDLRDQLQDLARQLERTVDISQASDNQRLIEGAVSQRIQQSERFESLVKQVRTLPGHERFLLHDEYATLARVAERGPVVVLVSSHTANNAVIIQSACHPITVPLPSLTSEWLIQSGENWRSSIREARGMEKARLKLKKTKTSGVLQRTQLDDILEGLWSHIVRPVFCALNLSVSGYARIALTADSRTYQRREGRQRPRLWWCPTGDFAHLPIHAAASQDPSECCAAYVVSSYVPTLGALLNARREHSPIARQDARVLVGAAPEPCGHEWTKLPSTREEAHVVARTLPAAAMVPLPAEDDALGGIGLGHGMRAETLLALLPDAAVLHLACHGLQDAESPLKSGFVMRDRVLTIEELIPVPLPRAFLAFLSACETAKGDRVGRVADACYPWT
jgi:tetratricopeptide (TPR) repeat protein